jgi:hypothetical protein
MRAERDTLQILQLLSIASFLAIQLFPLLIESVGLLGALGVILLVSSVLPQFIQFVRWFEAVIKITGGLSVKHSARLLLMMVSPSIFVFVCWLIENLVGINREQVWFVIAIITSIPFLILDIRLLHRKTPEFFY